MTQTAERQFSGSIAPLSKESNDLTSLRAGFNQTMVLKEQLRQRKPSFREHMLIPTENRIHSAIMIQGVACSPNPLKQKNVSIAAMVTEP